MQNIFVVLKQCLGICSYSIATASSLIFFQIMADNVYLIIMETSIIYFYFITDEYDK